MAYSKLNQCILQAIWLCNYNYKRVIKPSLCKSSLCSRRMGTILRFPNQHSMTQDSQCSPQTFNSNRLVKYASIGSCPSHKQSKPKSPKQIVFQLNLETITWLGKHEYSYIQYKVHNRSVQVMFCSMYFFVFIFFFPLLKTSKCFWIFLMGSS